MLYFDRLCTLNQAILVGFFSLWYASSTWGPSLVSFLEGVLLDDALFLEGVLVEREIMHLTATLIRVDPEADSQRGQTSPPHLQV
jgi:hypothetical protein